jgi:hypothetical protein
MNEAAPSATLTAATWNWTVHNKPTIEAACSGAWLNGGQVVIPDQWRNWSGSFQDGTVGVAPLNEAALAKHPRATEIKAAYDAEVAAFKSGEKTMVTIFTGTIKDNTGKVRIDGAPDIGKLYDDNGMWFVSNVVGSTQP